MPVRCDAAADRIYRSTSPLSSNAAYSVVWWARRLINQPYAEMLALPGSGDGTGSYDVFGWGETGAELNIGNSVLANTSGPTIPLNEWVFYAAVRESETGRLLLWANADLVITTAPSDVTGREANARVEFGGFGPNNYSPFAGDFDLIRLWSVALTGDEIRQEMLYSTPQRTDDLFAFLPCRPSAEFLRLDFSSNENHFQVAGALTYVSDGAPVLFDKPQRRIDVARLVNGL